MIHTFELQESKKKNIHEISYENFRKKMNRIYKIYNICTKRFIYVKIPDLIWLQLKG